MYFVLAIAALPDDHRARSSLEAAVSQPDGSDQRAELTTSISLAWLNSSAGPMSDQRRARRSLLSLTMNRSW
jgi:hypothetical protein